MIVFLTNKFNGIVVNNWNVTDLKKTIKGYINDIDKLNNIKLNAYNFALKNLIQKETQKNSRKILFRCFIS